MADPVGYNVASSKYATVLTTGVIMALVFARGGHALNVFAVDTWQACFSQDIDLDKWFFIDFSSYS